MSGVHDPSAGGDHGEHAEVKLFPFPSADCPVTPWPVIHSALISSLPPRALMHVFDYECDGGGEVVDLAEERRRRR